jgi:hypothetical protein
MVLREEYRHEIIEINEAGWADLCGFAGYGGILFCRGSARFGFWAGGVDGELADVSGAAR